MARRGVQAFLSEEGWGGAAAHPRPVSPLGMPHHPDCVARVAGHQKTTPLLGGLMATSKPAGGKRSAGVRGAQSGGVGSSTASAGHAVRIGPLGGSAAGDRDVEDGWAADGPLPDSLVLGEPVGRGTFGLVLGAKCEETGGEYAVKVLKKRKTGFSAAVMRAKLLNEMSVWKDLQECDDVVRLHKCYEDADHVYLVQDYWPGGTLADMLKKKGRLGEAETALTVAAILRMVHSCHARHIVYGDVKPSNVLVVPGDLHLAVRTVDFGSSRRLEAGMANLMVESGAPLYAAPEVHEPPYGLESDVWSVGVLLYQMLSGEPPFVKAVAKTMRDLNPTSLAYAIAYVELSFDGEVWDCISDGAKDLVLRMLERDVRKRITAEEALQHPWVQLHVGEAARGAMCGNIVQTNGGMRERTENENES